MCLPNSVYMLLKTHKGKKEKEKNAAKGINKMASKYFYEFKALSSTEGMIECFH